MALTNAFTSRTLVQKQDLVEKSNPYHDEFGRFTSKAKSKGGGVGGRNAVGGSAEHRSMVKDLLSKVTVGEAGDDGSMEVSVSGKRIGSVSKNKTYEFPAGYAKEHDIEDLPPEELKRFAKETNTWGGNYGEYDSALIYSEKSKEDAIVAVVEHYADQQMRNAENASLRMRQPRYLTEKI